MNVKMASDHPLTDDAFMGATGRTLGEWIAYLDAWGAKGRGRRAISDHLFGELKVDAWWVATLNVAYEAAHGVTEKDGRAKGYCICCTKTIAAPVEYVYAAWTNLEQLRAWFGATALDLADGGELRDAHGNIARFKRVRPLKDLRFEWHGESKDASLADVTFTEKGAGRTGIVITHDRIQSREEADGLRSAWGEALSALKARMEEAR